MQQLKSVSGWPTARMVASPRIAAQGSREERDLFDHTLTTLLATLVLMNTVVGLSPMSEGDADARATGGQALEILATVLPPCLAVIILTRRHVTALALFSRTWPIFLLLGWFIASSFWSDHPEIALRRSIGTALFALSCYGIAVGAGRLGQLLNLTFLILAAVIALNFAAYLLAPGFAVTPIGVRGIYTQKNVAGIVAMLAVLTGACWTLAGTNPLRWLLGSGVVVAALAFLWLTKSKTSVALTFAGLGMLVLLLIASRLGPRLAVAGTVLAICLALLFVLSAFALGVEVEALADEHGLDLSFTGRSDLWAFVMSESLQRPLLGFGYGTFWDVGLDYDPIHRAAGGSWLVFVQPGWINQAHNGYLDLAAQVGLPAMLVGTAVILGVLIKATPIALDRRLPHRGERAMALLCVVFFMIFLIHNAMESSLWARGQMLFNFSVLLAFMVHRFSTKVDPLSQSNEARGSLHSRLANAWKRQDGHVRSHRTQIDERMR